MERSCCRLHSTTRGAFTLIEILVVIALLAILVALALAGVSYSRHMSEAANRANWINSRRLDPAVGVQGIRNVRMLYFGNSLTQVNDLPRMVQALVQADGSGVTVEYQTQILGGSSLQQQWALHTTLPLIQSGPWDFVVLQEQATIPYADPLQTYTYVKKFDAAIKDQNAITLLYLSWVRQYDAAHQPKMNSVMFDVAKKLGAEVAPVGPAWQQSMQLLPKVQYYNPDQIHALPAGTYLAACVFYATIVNKSPVGLPGKILQANSNQVLVNLDQKTAQTLQQIAWQVTQDSRPLWDPPWRRSTNPAP
jgi:prepilin-type N-terminal cleavage/methylation domain-containing protein